MSRSALLDVNVLVALFDPDHIQHELAHHWFESRDRGTWATCPLTENGLVRVVSNPGYPGRRTTCLDALRRMRLFCRHEDHVFWPASVSILDDDVCNPTALQGHRQLTDVYLLALAVDNDGSLTSFDRSIPLSAVQGARQEHLFLLGA